MPVHHTNSQLLNHPPHRPEHQFVRTYRHGQYVLAALVFGHVRNFAFEAVDDTGAPNVAALAELGGSLNRKGQRFPLTSAMVRHNRAVPTLLESESLRKLLARIASASVLKYRSTLSTTCLATACNQRGGVTIPWLDQQKITASPGFMNLTTSLMSETQT